MRQKQAGPPGQIYFVFFSGSAFIHMASAYAWGKNNGRKMFETGFVYMLNNEFEAEKPQLQSTLALQL